MFSGTLKPEMVLYDATNGAWAEAPQGLSRHPLVQSNPLLRSQSSSDIAQTEVDSALRSGAPTVEGIPTEQLSAFP